MSLKHETEKLCHRWIVEYDCWRMWTKFSETGTVDEGITNRVAYEWRGNLENFGDRKTHCYRLLIHFMCKVAEAITEMSEGMSVENQHDLTTGQTTLEGAVDLLDYIDSAFTGLEGGELNETKLSLRRYAVLVPLHKNNRTVAKAVFDRQWQHASLDEKEMKYRDELAAMINDCDTAEVNLEFSEVLTKCQVMLHKIMTSMSKPFLVQAADGVLQELEANCTELVPSTSGLSLQQLPTKATGESDVPLRDDRHVCATKKPASANAQLSNGSIKSSSAVRSHTSGNNEQKSANDMAWISSVDDIWHPSTEWRRKGAGKVGVKIPWSAVEEELVYQGVFKHGVSNWALIRSDFLPNRSNVDIKDKWRTMKRQGRLQALAKKYRPLPASSLY